MWLLQISFFFTPGNVEAFPSPEGKEMATGDDAVHSAVDQRQLVDTKSKDFSHIALVDARKPCCRRKHKPGDKLEQGTCFLAENRDGFLYYLTAAHVIFCAKHKHYATEVALYIGEDSVGAGLEIIGSVPPVSPARPDSSWLEVCPAYRRLAADRDKRRQFDFGVIAFKTNVVKEMYFENLRFKIPKSWDKRSHHCTVSGFPSEVKYQGQDLKNQKRMFKDSGVISPVTTYNGEKDVRLWSYKIDASGGQSGSPVFGNDCTVFGIHVGYGPDKDNPEYNYAVVLDEARLKYAMSRFQRKGEKRGQFVTK